MAQLPPVIVYSGRELNEESQFELREFTDAIIVKGEFSSDRLKD